MVTERLIGGREWRDIVIVDYDAAWTRTFESHAVRIASALGNTNLKIEHIGSTSVPGLASKPIVDMLLVVADSGNESSYLPRLEEAGYELRVREPDLYEHRMLRTPERDVHIHVYSSGCPEIDRLLLFRNRLRSDARDRQLYEDTKRNLAKQAWPDMNAYADAKTDVVERILASATGSE